MGILNFDLVNGFPIIIIFLLFKFSSYVASTCVNDEGAMTPYHCTILRPIRAVFDHQEIECH